MKTGMKIWCFVGTLCRALVGMSISALYQDSETAILLGTGAGLIGGLEDLNTQGMLANHHLSSFASAAMIQ